MKAIERDEAVRLCLEGERLSPAERERLAAERLRELVAYVREHSAYYQKAYREVGEDFRLSDLPPVTKKELMADYGAWVTDPRVTEEGVRDYVRSDEALEKLYLGKYTALTTSGTTGKPMPMVRDACHNTIHSAMIQTRLLREVDPDLMNPVRHRIASIIILDPSVSSYSGFLKMQRANPGYEKNTLAIALTEDIDEIVEKLNRFQPDLITGYPSILAVIGKAGQEGRLRIQPQAIACSAETLTEKVYHTLRGAFGCPVLNNYCSTEGGEAAMSCSGGKLHVNEDWVIIEPVDKDGRPVPEGSWSEGVYVTDLTNYVQPIIRYYMEDKVRIRGEACPCGSTLPVMEIRGREAGTIEIGGKVLFSSLFEQALEHVPGVLAVQIAQKSERRFHIRLVPSSEGEREKAAWEVKERVLGLFEKSGVSSVEVTVVPERPRPNQRGGKVKFFVKELEEG